MFALVILVHPLTFREKLSSREMQLFSGETAELRIAVILRDNGNAGETCFPEETVRPHMLVYGAC